MRQLLLLLAWLSPLSVFASPELGIALKGGPNAATLAENYRSRRLGFTGGIASYLRSPHAGRLSIAGQIELLYTPRGAEASIEGEPLGRTRQHYLDIVLAARPEIRLGRASVYVLLGGSLDLLVSASQVNAAGGGEELTDVLHRVDVALLVGAGAAWHLPRQELGPFRLGTIFLELRHDHGLLDTDPINGGFKNRASSLMLGLSFRAGASTTRRHPSPRPGVQMQPRTARRRGPRLRSAGA
jgi:hypothetical protein